MPPSLTIKLVKLPKTVVGILFSFATLSKSITSSEDFGNATTSQTPPTLKFVYSFIKKSNFTFLSANISL